MTGHEHRAKQIQRLRAELAQEIERDPVFEAEVIVEAARRMLVDRRDAARRATRELARAQLTALDAKRELDAAVNLCAEAMWALVEAHEAKRYGRAPTPTADEKQV